MKSFLYHYRRHRFGWLFLSILLTLGFHPVLSAVDDDCNFLELLLVLNLLAAVLTVTQQRRLLILVPLAASFLVVRGLELIFHSSGFIPLGQALWTATCVLATVATIRYVVQPGAVDSERIFAALDVYLLVGLIFGVIYRTLDRVHPGSFHGAASSPFDLPQAIYFSFVTLATLGYGDIVPGTEAARGLAIFEAVGGQMYLVVFIARLVGMYSPQNQR
jgi:voltage-gated potassium channel Kch